MKRLKTHHLELYFSIIIPVYNRPDEVGELLESLASQTDKNFEVILVEDGSTQRCDTVARQYANRVNIRYYFKENSGRSQTGITGWNARRAITCCFSIPTASCPRSILNG